MATTTTTNLMSLDTKPIKSTQLSVRSSNVMQRQTNSYKNESYDPYRFDKVFDKYNESTSEMSKDTQDIVSDSAQDIKDPISAAITTSAHGKSKNTQDAPQKNESQTTEEVAEVQENEESPISNKRVTTMNLFSFVSVNIEEQVVAPTNVDTQSEGSSSDLMSILPQSQEMGNKAQDMLNLLSGRTWKINQQAQPTEQVQAQLEQSNEGSFTSEELLPLQQNQQLNNPRQMKNQQIPEEFPQLPNDRPIAHLNHRGRFNDMRFNLQQQQTEPFMMEKPEGLPNFMAPRMDNLQPGNFMQRPLEGIPMMNQPQVPSQIQETGIIPTISQSVETQNTSVTDPTAIAFSTEAGETINVSNVTGTQEDNNSQQQPQQNSTAQQEQISDLLLNKETATDQDLTAQSQTSSQNQSTNVGTEAQVRSVPQQQNPVEVQPQLNNEISQPKVQVSDSLQSKTQIPPQTENESQTMEQPQVSTNTEQTITTNNTQPQTTINSTRAESQPQTTQLNQSQNTMPAGTQSSTEFEELPPVHQGYQNQPQQVTYQPQASQQSQVKNQLETMKIPQVQAAISESQPEINNRQPQNQQNFQNVLDSEAEINNPQQVNSLQQEQQPKNQQGQQQQNQQAQQSANTEAETSNSAESNKQASTESFAEHLGAAANNTNSQPLNNTSNSLNQAAQTAQTTQQTEESITSQIVEHARLIRSAENTEMVIHLKPEHLGELTLRVSAATNGSVNVTFHSENAQVRAMIENTMVQLKNELSNQGLKVDNVQVSAHLSDGGMMNGRGQQAWEQNQRGNNNSRIGRIDRANGGGGLTAAEEAEIVSTAVVDNVMTADSVDYRV